MDTAHKKHIGKKAAASAKEEPIIVSDTVTETTERVEIIEEVTPETKSEPDPLTDFKEKMIEEEKSDPSTTPQKNFMWPIIFVFIIALVLLGGIFFYKQGMGKTDKVNVVSVANLPTITPEPTKAIDLSKYEIEVLNGSSVEGEASRQKTSLTDAGFTVLSVGNADNSDYTDTIIKAKKEVEKAFLDKLKAILGETFTIGEAEVLSDDDTTPVVVILGTKK
ncbi:MAG: LytR C-terminal domain-containing protein [bacterium]|nr:LytR C-terminal domain-containing protein [bacterium]